MTLATIVLLMAALGGIAMVAIRLSGAPRPPTWLAIGHGLIALTGVTLLAFAAAMSGIPQLAQISLGLFVLAALGGMAIFTLFHLRNLALPIPIVLGHAFLALSGIGLLLYSLFQMP